MNAFSTTTILTLWTRTLWLIFHFLKQNFPSHLSKYVNVSHLIPLKHESIKNTSNRTNTTRYRNFSAPLPPWVLTNGTSPLQTSQFMWPLEGPYFLPVSVLDTSTSCPLQSLHTFPNYSSTDIMAIQRGAVSKLTVWRLTTHIWVVQHQ